MPIIKRGNIDMALVGYGANLTLVTIIMTLFIMLWAWWKILKVIHKTFISMLHWLMCWYLHPESKRQLDWLQSSFPDKFIMWHMSNEYGCNTVNVRDANPDISVKMSFLAAFTKDLHIGFMFHGTDRDSISKICGNGIYRNSHATHSLESALHFSQQKECKKEGRPQNRLEVLVMAVLVSDKKDLENEDLQISYPHHSLPLFVITGHKGDN